MELSVDLQYIIFCICNDYDTMISDTIITAVRRYVILYMLNNQGEEC